MGDDDKNELINCWLDRTVLMYVKRKDNELGKAELDKRNAVAKEAS